MKFNTASCCNVELQNSERTVHFVPGADPGFSEWGFGQMSNCYCYLTCPFSQEKVWLNTCVFFTLEGSTEPPLDPPQLF